MNQYPFYSGSIATCETLAHLHTRLPKALAFLKRSDLAQLPLGRYEIDGEDCWASVQEVDLAPFGSVQKLEVHKAFIDIQAPLDGPETIGLKQIAAPFEPFDTVKDYSLGMDVSEPLTLQPGEFAIFFPKTGAHAPCRTLDTPTRRKKVVIKIRA